MNNTANLFHKLRWRNSWMHSGRVKHLAHELIRGLEMLILSTLKFGVNSMKCYLYTFNRFHTNVKENNKQMATVFETRLIGNLGKDASVKKMDRGVMAINFPVAHNKNWRDKRTGEPRTKTTWISCTIWKKEGANMRILDFLKSGTMVEVLGTPFAKAYQQEDGTIKSEIRLNISKTNILRSSKNTSKEENEESSQNTEENVQDEYTDFDNFTLK